jgi:hypothetical protein
MIWISGKEFYEKPGSCGTCPFFNSSNTFLTSKTGCYSNVGFCNLFEENHKSYINPPKRCQKLFNKAFRMPEGSRLVIVEN